MKYSYKKLTSGTFSMENPTERKMLIEEESCTKGKMKFPIVLGLVMSIMGVSIFIIWLAFGVKVFDEPVKGPMKNDPPEKKIYYKNGAVAADAKECSDIGVDMLKKGGHAVDAAIASLLCVGVVNFHSTGIGGGGFMTIYDKSLKKAIVYDYRETAPANTNHQKYDMDPDLISYGAPAVAVPGEIRGLKKIHDKYGKLPWSDLFQGAIDLAEKGTRIGFHMARCLDLIDISHDKGLREILINDETNAVKKEGDIVINKKYATTLRILSKDPESMYKGSIRDTIIQDMWEAGGNMTSKDLEDYEVHVKDPITTSIKGLKLHTTPLPGGGSILIHILNMIKGFNFSPKDEQSLREKILTYHRIVESFKFSYAMRPYLGDPEKVPKKHQIDFEKTRIAILSQLLADEHRMKINDSSTQKNDYYDPFFTTTVDEGTTHVSAIDKDGNAVAATDTINDPFGARIRSTKTGIIYNNEFADFFNKNTYGNRYPKPLFNGPLAGRRPLSSTAPSILTDDHGNVIMVIGGSGGIRITLSVAWVLIKKLILEYTLSDAIIDARPYHSFFPESVQVEKLFPLTDDIIKGLREKNHAINIMPVYNAIVQAIFVENGKIYAKSDPRKGGVEAGY